MPVLISTSTTARALKATLNLVITDTDYGRDKMVTPKWIDAETMDDNFDDDVEYGGFGLIPEKSEGAQIQLDSIAEGVPTRYFARTFALMAAVSEEAIEDKKYGKVINAAKRLKYSMGHTIDTDTANILVRGFDVNFPGGDGLPLFSASHPLPHSGTYSNLGTPATPSRTALTDAFVQAGSLPDHTGNPYGYELTKIVCPLEQGPDWIGIIGSSKDPDSGNAGSNLINVTNKQHGMMDLEVVVNRYWNNTALSWMAKTDCKDGGLNIRWRVKPEQRSWVNNDNTSLMYAIRGRWARGWSNNRTAIGNAGS